MEQFFFFLEGFENLLWSYIGMPALMVVGILLTLQSRFVQVRQFPHVLKNFVEFLKVREQKKGDVHPLKAFFACIGGCVGVGNIVGICTAVQIGGPGALLWIWVTAVVGAMVKYAEVYLGLKYRVVNPKGGYTGGPMYFLQRVFKTSWVPTIVCVLLCIYGVEVYQFSVVVNSLVVNWELNQYVVTFALLLMVLFAGSGGVRRVGNISSAIIPFFVLVYVGMGGWVLYQNISALPEVLKTVFYSAFSGHAAMGGFVGSGLFLAISQGVRRGCYTGDLGIGYASVIHSESCVKIPEKQASLVVFEIFLDTFIICTSSVLMILLTGLWHEPMDSSLLVQESLARYFPYMQFFMPLFLFILGYSTINAYFCVGLSCASHLAPRYGKAVYYLYAILSLIFFSFFDSSKAQTLMAVSGGLLLVLNSYGIFKLRKELSFDLSPKEEPVLQQA